MRTERWSINRTIINPNNGQRQNCIWEKKKLFLYTPVWSFKLICITETIGKYWQEVQESAKNVGRNPQELTCSAYLTVSIDDNAEKAQHRLDEYLQSYYGASADLLKPMMACFAGPLDAASEWLQGYTRAGASHLVLRFAGDHEQHLNMFTNLRADLGW